MTFFLIAAVLTAAVVLALVRPLWAARGPRAQAPDFNIAVYKDQLAELEREVARGVMSEPEAEAAKAEIGRRLLAEDKRRGAADEMPQATGANPALVMALVILLPVGAGAVYLALGHPGMPAHPFAEREGAASAVGADGMHAEMADAIDKIRARLAETPDNAEGWALLARSLVTLGREREALPAYARAVELTGSRDIRLLGEYAEAQTAVAGGTIGLKALELFKKVLETDPEDVRARYYVALWKAQSGDTEGAVKEWKAIVRGAPADAPWLPTLREQIAEIDPDAPEAVAPATPPSQPRAAPKGPSAEDVAAAAAMTPDQQSAMIEGMVAQLAARLQANPDDLDGWLRLGRSYKVLGKAGDARKAFGEVLRLDPDNATAKQAMAELGQ